MRFAWQNTTKRLDRLDTCRHAIAPSTPRRQHSATDASDWLQPLTLALISVDWDATLALHVKAYAYGIKHMALAVRQAEDKAADVAKGVGQAEAVAPQYAIVNMSSTVGVSGMPDIVRYATAKAGILGMTRQCAFDLGKHNIRCGTASQITSASYPSSQYTLISSASPLLGKSCNSQQEKSWLNVYQL